MFVGLQMVEAVRAQQDVCLPLQRLAKRMASLRHHVVEHTTGREDIHSAGLHETTEESQNAFI